VAHFLSSVPYEDLTPDPLEMPKRQKGDDDYVRPPMAEQRFVPNVL
jgi:hypothetical protein